MNPQEVPKLHWQKGGGLIPAIIQHTQTGAVLMLGYMNAEALEKTLAERRVTFFSRSRQRLWTKGERSGNYIAVTNVEADCDRDSLLITGLPQGPVCHTGAARCFPGSESAGRFRSLIAWSRSSRRESPLSTRAAIRPGFML